MKDLSLRKKERLCGEKTISALFSDGKSGFIFPFRYYWRAVERSCADDMPSVLFSVPKKQFKRAVRRNLLKRRSREAYRLNKSALAARSKEKGVNVNLALIYASKEISDFKIIENGIKRILAEIGKNL